MREPFPAIIQALEKTKLPVTSVDAPSSWNIENGPPESGIGSSFMPAALVSLTAPKPLVKYFKGRHFIGGRYVPRWTSVHAQLTSPLDLLHHPWPGNMTSIYQNTMGSTILPRFRIAVRDFKPTIECSGHSATCPAAGVSPNGFRFRSTFGYFLIALQR